MEKLGNVTTGGVGFRNFMLYIFRDEVLQQFDSMAIYSDLARSAYQNRLRSYSAIKGQ